MKKTRSLACLNGTALKLIAMVCMVFDHVGDNFFPEQTWLRVIGRIALPIFAFCVAEGFIPIGCQHDACAGGGHFRAQSVELFGCGALVGQAAGACCRIGLGRLQGCLVDACEAVEFRSAAPD